MSSGPKILVVDDEPLIRLSLARGLTGTGYLAEEAGTVAEALASLERDLPDLVLLDQKLPDGTGVDVLKRCVELDRDLPVVMITAHASVSGAVEAMQLGAYDYFGKPFELDGVLQTVARAIETGRLRREVAKSRELSRRKVHHAEGVIATSPAMQEVLRLVGRVATSEASTILLTGESGVGKGVVARMLHHESLAWDKPFMNITCTALPESLLESELFGHEKGAFTDAKAQKKGLFELADGGTIFLDEIGDLSMPLQGKLLRFLEEKSFRRVGGLRDLRVSVRIVAATNKDLATEVREKRFREDLYYRLNVIPIHIPPLRERREDIPDLAASFVAFFNSEFLKSVQGFDPEALACMTDHDWPGNVRELRNAVERAVLLTDGELLAVGDLPSCPAGPGVLGGLGRAGATGPTGAADAAGSASGPGAPGTLPEGGLVLEELERELVRQALEREGGNRTRAAKLLGLNRDQIRYRIEKFGLS